MVRGPFAMCDNSVLKMGSKIYDSTTLGPYCKVSTKFSIKLCIDSRIFNELKYSFTSRVV